MDITLLGGASLLSLSAFGILKSQLQSLYDKQKLYKDTPCLRPTQLLQLMKTKGQDRQMVFLQGLFKSDHPFLSKVNSIPLILSQYYIDNIYSNERIYRVQDKSVMLSEKPQYREVNGAPMFNITDFEEGAKNVTCKVTRNINAKANDALDLVGHKQHLRNLNPLDRLMILIGMVLRFVLRIKNRRGFKGFKIGVQEIEYGVQVNQILMVFGEVVADFKNGTLRMDKPLHILRDKVLNCINIKSTLIRLTGQRILNKSLYLLMTTILTALFLTLLTKRCILRYQKYQEYKRQQRLDKLRGVQEIFVSDMECIICYSRPRAIICKPCKHLSMCRQCYIQLQKRSCPICKQQIQDHVEIFIS